VAFDPSYVLLLPIGVAIAVAYTSTGISGANFWVPIYVLWLGFDQAVGFWLALLTMLFGSISGLVRHRLQRTIDTRAAFRLLLPAAPAAALGAVIAPLLPMTLPLVLFAAFALTRGALLLLPESEARPADRELPGAAIPAAGGALTGVISVGIGAMLLPPMLRSSRFRHHAEATGTTLLVVFLTSVVAVLGRLRPEFVAELSRSLPTILGVMAFVVPAVVTGGQLGPLVARRIPGGSMRPYVAALLLLVGALMVARLLA
jgi:uncharacterized membrane protein YfcA